MPALVVVMAGVEIYGGVAAMGTAVGFWATVAAGAEIVGGAMTIYGTATHNQDLANTGSIIGAAGMIGTGLVNSPSATPAPAEGVNGAAPAMNPLDPGAPGGQPQSFASSPAPETATTAAQPAGQAAGAYDKSLNSMNAKIDTVMENQKAFQSYNTKLMMLQGVATAYESHVNANIQAESQANYLAYQKSLTDRANANANARFNIPMSAQPLPPGMPTSGLLNTNQPGFYQPHSVKPAGAA